MTRSTLRRTAAAAAAVLALTSLAACGGGSDDDKSSNDAGSGSGSEPSDGASADSGDESDAPDDDATEEDAGDPIEKSEFIDLYLDAMDKATTATMKMNFGGAVAIEGTGSADFSTTPPSMKLSISDPSTGQDQEMILVDGIMYLALKPKKYIEFDLSDPNSPLGSGLTEQLDPTAMAEVFEKGITASAYIGEEDVDGESMEHYRVTLDSASLLDEADLPSDAPTDAIADEITFDMWFDDDGNFRRQEASLGVTGGTVELSYDNWGDPVSIKAPPESQITKLPAAPDQRPRMLPRRPFMLVGIGPLGIGMAERCASSALSRLRMSVISAGLT